MSRHQAISFPLSKVNDIYMVDRDQAISFWVLRVNDTMARNQTIPFP